MKTAFWDISEGLTPRLVFGALIHAGLPVDTWHREFDTLGKELGLGSFLVRVQNDDADAEAGVSAELEFSRDIPDLTPEEFFRRLSASTAPEGVTRRAVNACRLLVPERSRDQIVPAEACLFLVGAHLACHLLKLGPHLHSPFVVGTGLDVHVASLLANEAVIVRPHAAPPLASPAAAFILSLESKAARPVPVQYLRICTGTVSHGPGEPGGLLRLHLLEEHPFTEAETLYQVEATVDDSNPELYPPLLTMLRENGARDAWWTPAVTRSGRPGATVLALVPIPELEKIARILFFETSTIGIRYFAVDRFMLPRVKEIVQTSLGPVGIKTVTLPDGTTRRKPEIADCMRIAREKGRPIQEVRWLILRELEEL